MLFAFDRVSERATNPRCVCALNANSRCIRPAVYLLKIDGFEFSVCDACFRWLQGDRDAGHARSIEIEAPNGVKCRVELDGSYTSVGTF